MSTHKSRPKQDKLHADNQSRDGFIKSFIENFNKSWESFDREFDEMDKRIKERRKLNGKATNHEIDL